MDFIRATDFRQRVTEASAKQWVVVTLYKDKCATHTPLNVARYMRSVTACHPFCMTPSTRGERCVPERVLSNAAWRSARACWSAWPSWPASTLAVSS